jgi:hypothetical protein
LTAGCRRHPRVAHGLRAGAFGSHRPSLDRCQRCLGDRTRLGIGNALNTASRGESTLP